LYYQKEFIGGTYLVKSVCVRLGQKSDNWESSAEVLQLPGVFVRQRKTVAGK